MKVSEDGREKEREIGGTTTRSVEKGKEVLWSEGTAFKRSSNEYGGIDNTEGGSVLYRV